jgi:hypothetical protein
MFQEQIVLTRKARARANVRPNRCAYVTPFRGTPEAHLPEIG